MPALQHPLASPSGRAGRAAPRDPLLARPLQYMKGVGPKRYALLQRLMLHNVEDLLYFFPSGYKDRALVTPVAKLRAGQEANVRARIVDVKARTTASGKHRTEALLADGEAEIRAVWWNPYVAEKLSPDAWGFFSGKIVAEKNRRLVFAAPDFEILGAEGKGVLDSPNFERIVPVYSLRPKQRRPDGSEAPEVKLRQPLLRRLVWHVLQEGAASRLREDLPGELRRRRGLWTLAEAVRQIHFPDSLEAARQARRRLAYEELFLLSLGVALRRERHERALAAHRLPLGANIRRRIEARLPFRLTAAQQRAFEELARDMARRRPMNRLLQGDVGCGKTAVAAAAMLLAVAHGTQAVLLAPTEVLAAQHARTLQEWLRHSRVKIGLLRGGMKSAERAAFGAALRAGRIHLAVGTHALLEPGVAFQNLALVVMDEQHKFGVAQRSALRAKGRAPHVLVMTATPIPRTLSLTLYGDLDCSIIGEPPPGRGEILTRWVKEAGRPQVYRRIAREARKGNAAYVVLPRIGEDSDFALGRAAGAGGEEPAEGTKTKKTKKTKAKKQKRGQARLWSEVRGVEEECKRIQKQLPELRVGALHGRMPSKEKDAVLAALRAGELDVLVSTLVVEVGVDLPSASVMLIENAERFGLSSLHQLRGRIGRGAQKSYCFFFAHAASKEARQRLQAFAATRDGFKIAETDFQLRGPGQFFGTEQSGLPELTVADLIRDRGVLLEAREDAFQLVKSDPELGARAHAAIKRRVREVLGARLGLVEVG